jgi:anti-sigma regulatory factor (Ser/Thr protein kinase)
MISRIAEPSQVAEARRAAVALAQAGGLDATGSGRVALVVTEMATNLLKHAGGGDIIAQRIADADGDCLEVLALDGGPGIGDARRALEDGYSSAGSPGTGLGAIRRQADRFDLWSRAGFGTAVMARFVLGGGARCTAKLGAVMVPYPGETAIGDGWACHASPTGPRLFVCDGSGHGPEAAKATQAALRAFEQHPGLESARLAELIHRQLTPTRGAAIALAQVDASHGLVRFVGIGNISGALVSHGQLRRMVSHNGIAGHVAARIREFTYPFVGEVMLILHSDGLSAKWALDTYPGLAASHPSIIAGVLFRLHGRQRDDACVVVLRVTP